MYIVYLNYNPLNYYNFCPDKVFCKATTLTIAEDLKKQIEEKRINEIETYYQTCFEVKIMGLEMFQDLLEGS